MRSVHALEIDGLVLDLPHRTPPRGTQVLQAFFSLATRGLERHRSVLGDLGRESGAAIGRVRGTGPGVSFGALIAALERDLPRDLKGPFENSDMVAGGVWNCSELLGDASGALLKLRFAKGAVDLPLHVHARSDRFIVVLEGRGYFHVCPSASDVRAATDVRTVPVRNRDALVFTRGLMHTFSAPDEDLTLLSFHAPFIPLEDSDQYTIPGEPITPRIILESSTVGQVGCDAAWTAIA